MKVLLTGAQGQVGRAVAALCPRAVELHKAVHAELDITDAAAVHALIQRIRPEWIVNSAAYTAVDRAESEPALAESVNAAGPAHLANAAQALPGCRVLQLSTDYVFDGRSRVPYGPQDPTHPTSVYGRTKLRGEQAVSQTLAERATILRTAWVYAPQGRNFLLTMLRLMRERGEVRVVADQHGSPTSADSVARAVWAVLTGAPGRVGRILHWTDRGAISWYEFAEEIGRAATDAGLLTRRPRVTAICSADYPTAAVRPVYSVLDLEETATALGLTPCLWKQTLHAALGTLRSSA